MSGKRVNPRLTPENLEYPRKSIVTPGSQSTRLSHKKREQVKAMMKNQVITKMEMMKQ